MLAHNTLWTVTARYFGETNSEDGDLEVKGTYSLLDSANKHAQRLAAQKIVSPTTTAWNPHHTSTKMAASTSPTRPSTQATRKVERRSKSPQANF